MSLHTSGYALAANANVNSCSRYKKKFCFQNSVSKRRTVTDVCVKCLKVFQLSYLCLRHVTQLCRCQYICQVYSSEKIEASCFFTRLLAVEQFHFFFFSLLCLGTDVVLLQSCGLWEKSPQQSVLISCGKTTPLRSWSSQVFTELNRGLLKD